MPSSPPATGSGSGRGLWAAVLALCVAGLGAAGELTYVHVQAHLDRAASSFCALSETVNCDSVARETAYSVFMGVPTSVWGLMGYLTMLLVAVWGLFGERRAAAAGMLGALTLVSTVVSLVLGSISALVIRSVCIVCLATYLINVALLLLSVLLLRRMGLRPSVTSAREVVREAPGRSLSVAGAGLAVVFGLLVFYPDYWSAEAQAGVAGPGASAGVLLEGLATGTTEDGHFWIGAREPELVIEEFSDYECPHCGRAHWILRSLVQANPDRIRLVHRHFPLDSACNPIIQGDFHPRACALAALAACAGENGGFWKANDYIFRHAHDGRPFEVAKLAEAAGVDEGQLKTCLEERAAKHLQADLSEGIKLKINGTPTFRINGKVYPGELPADVLAPYLPESDGADDEADGEAEAPAPTVSASASASASAAAE